MQKLLRLWLKVSLVTTLVIIPFVLSISTVSAQADASCTASLPNRLSVGETGRIAFTFSTLRNAAGGAAIATVFAPASFTVIGGPTCVDGLFYVQVDYGNGQTGWANESEVASKFGNNLYWLEEFTPPPPPAATCAGSLPAQLTTAGQTGRIADVFSTLRSAPNAPGTRVDAPATFTVVTPSTCVNQAYWVQITYIDGPLAGQTGWALESQVYSVYAINRYWLEPAS